jgi:Zn-dependent peptidase ImmA (M78 family)
MLTPKASKVIPVAKAAQLWKLYGFESPSELVLEDLALALGVLVFEAPLERADARLIRQGNRGLVRLNSRIPEPGRKRFALAHELGHWVLHSEASQVAACTDRNMWEQYKGSPTEVEANYFASELLMPEHLLKPYTKKERPSFRLFSSLANTFNTSLTAMAMRYVELVNDYCAVVVCEEGKIRWWRGSEDFVERFWIEPGSIVSRDSVAGSVLSGMPKPSGPQQVDSEAWVETKLDYEHILLIEEVYVIGMYNQILSLLYL